MRETDRRRPILLGRLRRYPSGRRALVAGEGLLRAVADETEYRALELMNGFQSFARIAERLDVPVERVEAIYERLRGPGLLADLSEWNKLRWCPTCAVYVNSNRVACCPVCAGALQLVPLSPPADPWPCMGDERRWLCERLATALGAPVPPGVLLLANNGLEGGRFFWEVVAAGRVAMRVDFAGPEPDDWRVTPLDGMEALAGHVPAADDWEEEFRRHIRANDALLEELAADSIAFIDETCGRSAELPLVYFSGGKESMVTLDLFRRAGVPAQLLFAGVGMDFPEDEAFIRQVQRELESDPESAALFKLHVEPGEPEAALAQFARHGRLDPSNLWCRSEVKYPIRNRAVRKLYPDGHRLAFEGSRRYETDYRRGHPRVNRVADIAGYDGRHQLWGHVLAEWNGFDVWSYIVKHALPTNPLYRMGFQRTTCWSCPLVNPFHLRQSRRYHPELWDTVAGYEVAGFEAAPRDDAAATPF